MHIKAHELETDALADLAAAAEEPSKPKRKSKAKAPNPLASKSSKARQHPIRHQIAEKGVKKKIRRPQKKKEAE